MNKTSNSLFTPSCLSEIIGQKNVINALVNELNKNFVIGLKLFIGPYGVGKTRTAEIYARTLNCDNREGLSPCNNCSSCVNPIDTTVINCSSAGGGLFANDFINNISPPIISNHRVYILDEFDTVKKSEQLRFLEIIDSGRFDSIVFIFIVNDPLVVDPKFRTRLTEYKFVLVSAMDIKNLLVGVTRKDSDFFSWVKDSDLTKMSLMSNGSVRSAFNLLLGGVEQEDSKGFLISIRSGIGYRGLFKLASRENVSNWLDFSRFLKSELVVEVSGESFISSDVRSLIESISYVDNKCSSFVSVYGALEPMLKIFLEVLNTISLSRG